MKTATKRIILVISGLAATTAFAMAVKRRKTDQSEIEPKEQPKEEKKEDGGAGGTTPLAKTYSEKIMKLQSLLYAGSEQCTVDGQAGKQTNGMLDYWFCDYLCEYDKEKAFTAGYPNLKKLGKGKVSPSNVDYYIAVMQKGTSPRKKLLVYLDRQQKAKEQFAKLGIKI